MLSRGATGDGGFYLFISKVTYVGARDFNTVKLDVLASVPSSWGSVISFCMHRADI